jgi:hypothetical protein
MLGFLLRIVFFAVMARLAARLLSLLTGRPKQSPAPPPRRGTRLAGDIVDAEFEDLSDGRR